jgi:hypothetical protein
VAYKSGKKKCKTAPDYLPVGSNTSCANIYHSPKKRFQRAWWGIDKVCGRKLKGTKKKRQWLTIKRLPQQDEKETLYACLGVSSSALLFKRTKKAQITLSNWRLASKRDKAVPVCKDNSHATLSAYTYIIVVQVNIMKREIQRERWPQKDAGKTTAVEWK